MEESQTHPTRLLDKQLVLAMPFSQYMVFLFLTYFFRTRGKPVRPNKSSWPGYYQLQQARTNGKIRSTAFKAMKVFAFDLRTSVGKISIRASQAKESFPSTNRVVKRKHSCF